MSLPAIASQTSLPPPQPSPQQHQQQPQPLHDVMPPPQPQFAEPPLLTKLSPHIAVLLAQLIETRPAEPLQFCAEFFSARARAELATAAAAAAASATATAAAGAVSSSSSSAAPLANAPTAAQTAPAAAASVAAAALATAQAASSTSAPASLPAPSSVYARRNKDAILDTFVTRFFESNPICDPLTGEIGLGGSEFAGVLSRACVDFPPEITKATIEVFATPGRDFIAFRDFTVGIHASLLFGDFIARVEALFGACLQDANGRVSRSTVEDILRTIRTQSFPMPTPTAAHLDEALHTLDQLRCGDRVAYREFALALFRTTALPFELPDAPRGSGAAPAASASVHRVASVAAAASEMGAGAWRGPVGLQSPNGSTTATATAATVAAPAPASAPAPRDEMTSLAALLRSAGQSAPGAASAAMNLTSLLASLTSYEGSARGEPSARGEAVGRAP